MYYTQLCLGSLENIIVILKKSQLLLQFFFYNFTNTYYKLSMTFLMCNFLLYHVFFKFSTALSAGILFFTEGHTRHQSHFAQTAAQSHCARAELANSHCVHTIF